MIIPLINPSPSRGFKIRIAGGGYVSDNGRPVVFRTRAAAKRDLKEHKTMCKAAGMTCRAGDYSIVRNPCGTKRSVKRANIHRASTPISSEGSMVYRIGRKRKNPRRRTRRNSAQAHGLSFFPGYKPPRRRKARKSRRLSKRVLLHTKPGWHRVKLLKRHGKWFRPRRSSLRRGVRINPFRLPRLPYDMQNVALGGVKIAGGIAIGIMATPYVNRALMLVDKSARFSKFYGLAHVVLGAVAASMIKRQPLVRDMALTVAGVGVYDLIAKNVPMLNLPALTATPAPVAGEPGVIGVDADMEPALLGSSYEQMGASYVGADDIAYGDDSIELE